MRLGVRLGLDPGDARIGVARSDPTGFLATPVETVRRGRGDVSRLRRLVTETEAVEVAEGASYFDLALGRLGGVLAAPGSDDAPRRRHWFEQLRNIATSAGDTVFLGLSQALAREPATIPETLGPGWRSIVEQSTVAAADR